MIARLLLLTLLLTAIAVSSQPAPDFTMKIPERERQNLRGPVKTIEEENTYPAIANASGNQIPERKSFTKTEFDPEGRVASSTQLFDGRKWVIRYVYDPSGRLLKTVFEMTGQPQQETVYNYNESGRLTSITSSHKPDNPIVFRYDDHGRKSQISTARAEDYRPNVATGGSPFDSTGQPPNIPGGGTSTVLYDEQDRPTEVQVRNARGELISHSVRTYDSKGRITEEKQILDHPELLIPEDVRDNILQQTGASPSELQREITEKLGQASGLFSATYSYDAKGRVTHSRELFFGQEQRVETTYNEHGDTASRITRTIPPENTTANADQQPQPPALPSYSETQITYIYDTHGNWTEETTSYRNAPDADFQPSSHRHRTITYW